MADDLPAMVGLSTVASSAIAVVGVLHHRGQIFTDTSPLLIGVN